MDQKKLLMFDFDGVIADSLEFFHHSLAHVCDLHGLPAVKERSVFLDIFDGNMSEGLCKLGLEPVKIPVVIGALRVILSEGFDRVNFFPRVVGVLNQLAADHAVYVITSNLSDIVADALSRQGVVGVRDVLGSDKDPSKVKKIRQTQSQWVGCPAFYTGDTLGDMIEGREAGAKTIGVGWGWHGCQRLSAAQPDFLVEHPDDLFQVI